ncbi:MAG: hypothetical protein IT435_00580 [Phycisphaerales bacterium]|nr:hypothetical protein [Phycisphaerales bacterium]
MPASRMGIASMAGVVVWIAGAASGQHGLKLHFSTDNGATWQDDVTVDAGSRVLARVFVTITDRTGGSAQRGTTSHRWERGGIWAGTM